MLSHGLVTMVTNLTLHSLTLAGASFCINLRSLNACHFGMVEATRLKFMVSRSSSMA
jgi:hypothetical protein